MRFFWLEAVEYVEVLSNLSVWDTGADRKRESERLGLLSNQLEQIMGYTTGHLVAVIPT
jgi:hypothetical protein